MTTLTNNSKTLQIVILEDGSSIFMKHKQVSETDKKIRTVPNGVDVKEEEKISPPKKTQKQKEKEDSSEEQNLNAIS